MRALALTLGHNSSAVLIEDGKVLCGYEEERLSGVKSDSAFPRKSINMIDGLYQIKDVEFVCVSHWETYGKLNGMSAKHWDPMFVADRCPEATILSHGVHFTHHDAHMEVAKTYSPLDGYTIVADGFGNFNEVISVYYGENLIHRVHGYDKSLGLLYQYATAFLGMKMNQDEYKLLGYEAHTDKLGPEVYTVLTKHIAKFSKRYALSTLSRQIRPKTDALCNVEALSEIRVDIQNRLRKCINEMDKIQEMNEETTRISIAHLVQSVVEQSIGALVDKYHMSEVTLVGGLFYNVKLNNYVLNRVDKICVLPLAGDQGCGMGVYQHNFKDLEFPKSLCIGKRNLKFSGFTSDKCKLRTILDEALIEEIIGDIDEDKIVNVIHGDMEFGPRALGNTTTLMLPYMRNVDYVNHLNGRSTIMPCAPITTKMDYFQDDQVEKVVKSHEHMIITLDYKPEQVNYLRGAAHKYPFCEVYSGRPQLIYGDHWLYDVVDKFGLLINTSYNKHGSPILFSEDQIAETFFYQLERDNEDRVVTYIIL